MYKKNHKVTVNSDGTTTIKGKCVFIGIEHSVTVDSAGYLKWEAGELIQKALGSISADDREFLISGISPEGWKKTFG